MASAAALFVFHPANEAAAQCVQPLLCSDVGNANIAASSSTFDLGDQFFRSLLRHGGGRSAVWPDSGPASTATASFGGEATARAYASEPRRTSQGAATNNTLDNYAAVPTQTSPQYRAWFEGYGSRAHTAAQRAFTGDARASFGGIAGIGATFGQNVSLGASVDQGRTVTDVTGGTQSSRLHLTQIGLNSAFASGPWTLGIAGIHGFGDNTSTRLETRGPATATYGTHMWGALGELSYYWSSGSWRVVPKTGLDWMRVSMDSFAEAGGTTPLAVSGLASGRTRAYGTLELGYTTAVDQAMVDISAYGKAIDTVSQNVGSVVATALSPGLTPRVVPGLIDARFELATGAALSVRLGPPVRLYATYDGRFRNGYNFHGGTLGLEVRW